MGGRWVRCVESLVGNFGRSCRRFFLPDWAERIALWRMGGTFDPSDSSFTEGPCEAPDGANGGVQGKGEPAFGIECSLAIDAE